MREREVAAFGEDNAHRQVVGALVQRLASESGIEFAEDIVLHMDIEAAARTDPSLHRFVDALRGVFRQWEGGG